MPVFSPRLNQQRMKFRPIRPNPFIATRKVIRKTEVRKANGGDHTEIRTLNLQNPLKMALKEKKRNF